MRITANHEHMPDNSCYQFNEHLRIGTLLFDLESDPKQQNPIKDEAVEERMIKLMKTVMDENEAPEDQYQRMGFA